MADLLDPRVALDQGKVVVIGLWESATIAWLTGAADHLAAVRGLTLHCRNIGGYTIFLFEGDRWPDFRRRPWLLVGHLRERAA